ncbi:MAG: alpha/beta hydrolase [Gammaproteobacteria bacterium]|nr:MAG: alpha/beta hydrolase [Gammaproteobacteria bacterium]
MQNLSPGENKLSLPGEVGNIEAILHLPRENVNNIQSGPIFICCHPHPLYGGAMSNKVVHTLCRTFSKMGLPSLRFNFRGVGESKGTHDNGIGESRDLLLLCNIMKQNWPDSPLWLAGFSFGSWVAAHTAKQVGAEQLLSIAPPVKHFDFDTFDKPDCPWLILMGEEDEIVEPQSVFDWVDSQKSPPTLIKFAETGHFFHRQLVNMGQLLQQHYQNFLSDQ